MQHDPASGPDETIILYGTAETGTSTGFADLKADIIVHADYSALEERIAMWMLAGMSNLEIGTLAHEFLLGRGPQLQPEPLGRYIGDMRSFEVKMPVAILRADKPHTKLPRHRKGNFKRRQRR